MVTPTVTQCCSEDSERQSTQGAVPSEISEQNDCLFSPSWAAAVTTVLPGDFTESTESEKHALRRPSPSPTHLLLPSPHSISPPELQCWGPKGPQTPFSPCLLQSYPERSRNCQDTEQRTEPKSADPRAAALFQCPHGLPIIRRGAQLSRAGAKPGLLGG